MNVAGLARTTRRPSISPVPSEAAPAVRHRAPSDSAIRSIARNPALWSVEA